MCKSPLLPPWIADAAVEIAALVRRRTGLPVRGLERQIQLVLVVNEADSDRPAPVPHRSTRPRAPRPRA